MLAIIGVAAAVALLWWGWTRSSRKKKRDDEALDLAFLQVFIPKKVTRQEGQDEPRDAKESITTFRQLLENLHGTIKSYLVLEIAVIDDSILFFVGAPTAVLPVVEKQINALYPDANVGPVDEPVIFAEGTEQAAATVKAKKGPEYVLRTYQQLDTDPLNAMTNAMSKLTPGDGLGVQLLLRPAKGWQKDVKDRAKKIQQGKDEDDSKGMLAMVGGMLKKIFGGGGKKDDEKEDRTLTPEDQERVKRVDTKAAQRGYHACLRLVSSSRTAEDAKNNLESLSVALGQYALEGDNELELEIHEGSKARAATTDYIWRRWTAGDDEGHILSTEEAASIIHFPDARFNKAPDIKWQLYKIAPPPDNLPESGLLLGHSIYRNQRRPIYLKNDDRFRHFYVIGQTGTGKSSIILTMALHDVRAGNGFGVIDPHGQLAKDVLPYIPKERADDVIYFNPADLERPIGLNLIEAETEDDKDGVVGEAMAIMLKMYGPEVFGPRIQDYFRNAVLTLLSYPAGGTLVDIMPLFTDPDFKNLRTNPNFLKNPVVRAFWDKQIANTGQREQQEIVPYLAAKFGGFTTNSQMRNIIGQTKSGFDFSKAMQEGKILLINLSKGEIGDVNSKLLGLIITAKLQSAAMKRERIPKEQRRDFFLYMDEFQNYVSDSIESILSEARKYRFGLVVAHQYLGQLEQSNALTKSSVNLKNAIFGNVGNMMCYKIGPPDDAEIAKIMAPVFSESDLVNVDVFKGAMRLSIDNQPSIPFTIAVQLPWLQKENVKDDNVARAIVQLSRLKYGRDRDYVNKEILARIGL